MIALFWLLTLLVLSRRSYRMYKNKNKKIKFDKRTDQNFIARNCCHIKDYLFSKERETEKQCQKEVIMDIHWLLVGGGPFFGSCIYLAGGGWWCVVVDIF